MRKLHALLLAGGFAVLGCSISDAAQVFIPSAMHATTPAVPGDCLSFNAVPSLGWTGTDTGVPCTPSFLTTAYTNATTSYTAIMALPPTQAATTLRGECTLTYEDSSTSGTVTFGAGLSAAPTDLWVTAHPTTGAFVAPTFETITGTTTTAVTGALATTTANAPYQVRLSFTLANATAANVLTIYAQSNSTSYTASVLAGSSCSWLP